MTTNNDICERWRWLGIRLKEEGMHQQGDALIQAATIAALRARVEELEKHIKRLGSSEAMTTSFYRRDNQEGRELLARMEYARQALGEKP